MKRNRKFVRAFILGMAVFAFGTFGGAGLKAEAAIKLSSNQLVLIKGQKKVLKVKGTKKKAVWSSTRKKIASVGKKGKVTARKKGAATIRAKIGSRIYRCKVIVEEPKLNKYHLTLKEKQTASLKLSGTSRKVTWKSSKKGVASVSKKGKVTAKKKGTAVITASVGGKKYSCTVVVGSKSQDSQKPAPVVKVSGVTLNQNELTIINGFSDQLIAAVQPANATDKNLVWESSNTKVASVDANGKVTACGVGTAIVRVSCGGKSASCVIRVIAEKPKLGIRLIADKYSPVDYLNLSVVNYQTKPLTINSLVMLETEEEITELYIVDNGVYVPDYTITRGVLSIPICKKPIGDFTFTGRSYFSFLITYDGIQYIGAADYYGETLELYELSDMQKESGISDYRELLKRILD